LAEDGVFPSLLSHVKGIALDFLRRGDFALFGAHIPPRLCMQLPLLRRALPHKTWGSTEHGRKRGEEIYKTKTKTEREEKRREKERER
jgi:hypothetical protein